MSSPLTTSAAPSGRPESSRPSPAAPRVGVMMAVRQEGPDLAKVLDAVLAQDYDALTQIVVAVGPSGDGTPEIVARAAQRDRRVLVVENPEGIVSTGLNRALERLDTTLVVRIDGHCLVPPDYVSRLVSVLGLTGASCAGPRLRTVGAGHRQEAIAAVMSSVLGVGASKFRTSTRSGFVDTVAFGLYDRQTLLDLGGFRPELVRNQDDELNARLRRAGGTVYLDGDLTVDYYPRSTFQGLFRQYFEYGYWRTVTADSFGDRLGPRQQAPGVLVLALATAGTLAAVGRPRPLLLLVSGYAAGLMALGVQTRHRTGRWTVAALAMPAGAVLHLSYGTGLWYSAARRLAGVRQSGKPSGELPVTRGVDDVRRGGATRG